MKRRFPIITKKIVFGIVVSGFLLCSVVFSAGYWSFSRQFRKEYDSNIRAISEAARECLNPDDFALYLKTATPDERYEGVLRILQDFVNKFELNLLYVSAVSAPDYTDITYIYNPVMQDGRWRAFPLGYTETYVEPHYNSSAKRVFENGEVIVRHTFRTRSGSHITAMVPVYDSDGKIVAVLGAQKSIQEFVDARRSFAFFVIVLELLFAALIVILFSAYFNVKFIRPLVLITHETDHFASYGGEPTDSLLSITNRDEIGTLAHTVLQMERDVCRNIKELTRVTAEKERISTELNVATQIQADALPTGYPAFPSRMDFDLFATMSPAKEVGGDLYDYQLLDYDHLMLVVGDVSGKGVPAALFMMTAKTLLSSLAMQGLSPREIFMSANDHLCNGNSAELFVTCWLGILTFSTGELRFVNAGHPYPVLFHEGEFGFIKEKPNFVLGGMPGIPYKEHSLTLNKGDRLFVYSDGVTEATSGAKKLFGEERLLSAVSATAAQNAPDTLKSVRCAIDEFVGNAEQFDDITMLQFEWKKA